MTRLPKHVAVLAAVFSAGMWTVSNPASAAVTFDWATVGNVGNANDSTGYGAVAYTYQISKKEVTNSQYAEFLNAKAGSDPLALYNTNMSAGTAGGITRSGSSGSYTYTVNSGYANKPVAYVSWYDSIRFANWMNNGQGNANTESGAYTILGGTATPSNGNSITRNGGANVFLTSEDEWYKSAYHQPAGAGGDSDGYWDSPTRSNTAPTSEPPPGGSNGANYADLDIGYAVGSPYYVTDVGAYTASGSYYGTFDQGGNVWEWNEALIDGSYRGFRGGSWHEYSGYLRAGLRGYADPSSEYSYVGFRVASIPEPTSAGLALFSAAALVLRRRRAMS